MLSIYKNAFFQCNDWVIAKHTFIAIITDNTTNFPKAFRIFGLNSKSMNKLLGEENEEEEEREESVKKTIFRERKEKKKTEK